MFTRYTRDARYGYQVVARGAALFQVWVQQRFTHADANGVPYSFYGDIAEPAHFAASLEDAVRLGDGLLELILEQEIPKEGEVFEH